MCILTPRRLAACRIPSPTTSAASPDPVPTSHFFAAADLLGTSLAQLKRDIDDGVIVAVSTPLGPRVSKEELMAAAMRVWE
jgi:hypothetical protein